MVLLLNWSLIWFGSPHSSPFDIMEFRHHSLFWGVWNEEMALYPDNLVSLFIVVPTDCGIKFRRPYFKPSRLYPNLRRSLSPFKRTDDNNRAWEARRIYEQSFCEGYYSFYFNDLSDVTELTFKVYQIDTIKRPLNLRLKSQLASARLSIHWIWPNNKSMKGYTISFVYLDCP